MEIEKIIDDLCLIDNIVIWRPRRYGPPARWVI